MTPEFLSSVKMNYPCGYEYLVGQQQPLHNIQLIYPAAAASGYSSLAGQAVTQSPVSSVLHPAMSAAAVAAAAGKLPALPSSVSQMSPVSAAAGAAAGPSQLVPHREKKYRPPHKTDKFTPKPIPPELGNLKTYSNPDILICGNCRELFNDIVDMLEHKRIYCKMRFTCKCDQGAATDTAASPASQAAVKAIEFSQPSPNKKGFQDEGAEVAGAAQQGKKVHLKCSQCKEVFSQAWDLMFHAQNAHGVNIYKLSEKNNSESNAAAP